MSRESVHGIGVDIVKISRIEQAVKRWGERFLKRVFTEAERRYCFKKARPHISLAARFAAKEAFVKALSAGKVIPLKEIEVINNPDGAPFIKLYGSAREIIKSVSSEEAVHLSLSHDGDYAVAFVVIERKREAL